jgi:nitroreductase
MDSTMTTPGSRPAEYDVMAALYATPARRFLSSEPVPDDIVRRLVDVAARSPLAGETYGWAWIAVTDRHSRQTIAHHHRMSSEGGDEGPGNRRDRAAADHVATLIEEAPVLVVPVLLDTGVSGTARSATSFYHAVGGLATAAQRYGLWSSATLWRVPGEDRIRHLLDLPDSALVMAVIPVGYPIPGREPALGRSSRPDLHWNSFGAGRSPW